MAVPPAAISPQTGIVLGSPDNSFVHFSSAAPSNPVVFLGQPLPGSTPPTPTRTITSFGSTNFIIVTESLVTASDGTLWIYIVAQNNSLPPTLFSAWAQITFA